MVAFSRSAASIDIEHPNLEKINGNALNQKDLEKPIAKCEVVIQTLGVPLNIDLIKGPIKLFSNATKNIIQLMEQYKVSRLISVTGYGAGDSYSSIHPLQKVGFKLVFGRAYSDKDIQESLIKNSLLDWTIVRPGVLINCSKLKNYKVLEKPADWRNGIISRYSVADFIIGQVEQQTYIRKCPVLVA